MALALHTDERRVIEAVLRFANLARVDTADGYARVMRCFAKVIDARDSIPMWFDPDGSPDAPAVDLRDTYVDMQRLIRKWLDRIIASERNRSAVAREIGPALEESVISTLSFDGRRLGHAYGVQSVQGACALGVALILDEGRGLTSRLKCCGWSKCRRFNLDLDAKGRPRRHCSTEHKARADLETVAERVRKHRAEQELKKRS